MQRHVSDSEFKDHSSKIKPTPIAESTKEEPGWPSFGQLIIDLSKLAVEALTGIFLSFTPSRFRHDSPRNSLTPLKDTLRMPEDEVESTLIQRQSSPAVLSENRQGHTPNRSDKYLEKPPKNKSSSFKDPSLSSKHRSSKRQDYAEFYGSGEVPPYSKSKSQKERTRHRQRDKSGEVVFESVGTEPKPVEMKTAHYGNPKFEHYNISSKYGSDDSYRF